MADYSTRRRETKRSMNIVYQQVNQYKDMKEYNQYLTEKKIQQQQAYIASLQEEEQQVDETEKQIMDSYPIVKQFQQLEPKKKDEYTFQLRNINSQLMELNMKTKKSQEHINKIQELHNKKNQLRIIMTKIDKYNKDIKLYNKFELKFIVNVQKFQFSFINEYKIKITQVQSAYLYITTYKFNKDGDDTIEYANYINNHQNFDTFKNKFLTSKNYENIKNTIFQIEKDKAAMAKTQIREKVFNYFNQLDKIKDKEDKEKTKDTKCSDEWNIVDEDEW